MGYDPTKRVLVYAEGAFGWGRSKTAEGVIRYGANPIVGVIDSSRPERDAGEVIGPVGRGIPIFPDLRTGMLAGAEALLLGIAPPGGRLPPEWRPDLVQALQAGMQLVNGLHMELARDPELAAAAERGRTEIWDVREPRGSYDVANGRARRIDARIVLAVGTDCAIGKMTVMLEMQREAQKRGIRAGFVATGQTGIMIAGKGVPLDRVIGDFMAGAIESTLLEQPLDLDWLLVEGQGSLYHPGFSGVTLSLLHGAAPTDMILCHEATRTHLRDTDVTIPPLPAVIQLHEALAAALRPAKVRGVALNTRGLDDAGARRAVETAAAETGLPTTDAVRFGAAPLVDALERTGSGARQEAGWPGAPYRRDADPGQHGRY